MCATFNIDDRIISKYLGATNGGFSLRKSGDVFPSETAVIITVEQPLPCKWGYSRFDGGGVIYNARAETVLQKRTFSSGFSSKRCVVPVRGFYEYGEDKRKLYFTEANGADEMFLCGFYRTESDGDRFVVLTKNATYPVSEFHGRIPVIADHVQTEDYLCDTDYACGFIMRDATVPVILRK